MAVKTLLIACASLLAVSPALAQDAPHQHQASDQVGSVRFPISCTPEAQSRFERAVAWLHSFEYQEAERAFLETIAADPSCAMGHWGVAMSQYHPLWAPPTPAELAKARAALVQAQALRSGTEREQGFIAALSAFFDDSSGASHRDRTLAYEAAMGALHQSNPEDSEAAIFHALALIAAGMVDDDSSFDRERRAATILDQALAAQPDHPGVTHYLIHGYDYPPLAHLAIGAARRYAGIAPASAHAQHMPSHIFTRLGLWDDAIRSNLAAEASARAYTQRNSLAGTWEQQLHAMDYLAYAYLQRGQNERARDVRDRLGQVDRVFPVSPTGAYALSAVPARYALERRQWREAAALALPANVLASLPWAQFPWGEGNIRFARAVGSARSGNAEAARLEIAELDRIRQALAGASGYDWGTQIEIQRGIAAAWAAEAGGSSAEALRLMRAAADLDDATEKHPVTPGAILPAREQLGELLLEQGRPSEALAVFQATLERAPGRFNAVYGAARSARRGGEPAQARTYYRQLIELGCGGDGARRELAEARRFLGRAAPRCTAART
jgi:tetratricopeptide (TPR) repeat protein